MARTGRPPSTDPRKKFTIRLNRRYIAILDHLDRDPFFGRRDYGKSNEHIEKALDEYFAKYYPNAESEMARIAAKQKEESSE